MTFENLMLRSLFAACLLVCALTLGSMLVPHAVHTPIATSHVANTAANDAG